MTTMVYPVLAAMFVGVAYAGLSSLIAARKRANYRRFQKESQEAFSFDRAAMVIGRDFR